MPSRDEAVQALRLIARLAEEHGDALDRAFRLFGDGALLGPRAARLHAGLVNRCGEVGQAFTRSFHQVERLATARGDPAGVPAPHLRRPPGPLRAPPGGFVGGDPDLMQVIDTELTEVGESWQRAGQVMAATLVRLGLDGSPGQDIGRAGGWLVEQRPDLRRRREELLKTTPAPTPEPPPRSVFDTATDAVTDTLSRVGEVWADQVAGLVPGAGGLAHGYAGRVAVPFAQGVAEAAIGAARFGWDHSLGGLITNPTGPVERARAAYDSGEFAAGHPVEFAKSVLDWETLTEDPARWFGRLVPDLLLGGGAAATRAGRAVDALTPARATFPDGTPVPPPRTAADGPPLATIPMGRKFVGEDHRDGVLYLDAAERESKRLVVHDGKLYDVHGRLFDTTEARSHFSGEGRAIFVMDQYGNLYAHKEHEVGVFHHSSFLGGAEVAGAGDFEVKNGVLKVISRHSGHYHPAPEDLQRVVDRLRSSGVDFDGVIKEGYDRG
ncbi:hypothetical protein [Nonomuraea sp. NPDC048826]|uniref:hypothetical protein n=1 Tax=Nonomuraea sp. NPDC048826 TaxID=3364347 RepID=UPI003717CBB8